MSLFFEDIEIGATLELGAHLFTEEDILRYAQAYDPQDFHLSPEKAAQTHFGKLCASGWHTASVWMRKMVDTQTRLGQEAIARGERPAKAGPSPGFKNLIWKRPVFVGDTIRYTSTITDKRPSKSRPDWGLLMQRNEGVNQDGNLVLSFEATVFIERRNKG
jgi:acyl dehydratase